MIYLAGKPALWAESFTSVDSVTRLIAESPSRN
jgi:hypothetical protein